MSKTKNNYSVAKVVDARGKVIGYLSTRDMEKGLDIQLDMLGYKIIAI